MLDDYFLVINLLCDWKEVVESIIFGFSVLVIVICGVKNVGKFMFVWFLVNLFFNRF